MGLAAGYYAYRDLFRTHVDHHQLRKLMLIDPARERSPGQESDDANDVVRARVDSYLDDTPTRSEWKRIVASELLFDDWDGSVVALIPGPDSFHITVGILGQYLGSVSVPADTRSFPNEGHFHWGHAISVVRNTVERRSWFGCMQQWAGISS